MSEIKILSSYFKFEKLTEAKTRYDLIASTGDYPELETLLLANKRGFSIGGQRISLSTARPTLFKKKSSDYTLLGTGNISAILGIDLSNHIGYGDIHKTEDACIIVFNSDYLEVGVNTIELYISENNKFSSKNLCEIFRHGDLDAEIELLIKQARIININNW